MEVKAIQVRTSKACKAADYWVPSTCVVINMLVLVSGLVLYGLIRKGGLRAYFIDWLLGASVVLTAVQVLTVGVLFGAKCARKLRPVIARIVHGIVAISALTLSLAFLAVSAQAIYQGVFEWGPILQGYGDDYFLTWYTKNESIGTSLQRFSDVQVDRKTLYQTVIKRKDASGLASGHYMYRSFTFAGNKLRAFAVISDTHNNWGAFEKYRMDDAELIVIVGDVSTHGLRDQFTNIFNKLPLTQILMVSGNHDAENRDFDLITKHLERTFVQRVGDCLFYQLYLFKGYELYPDTVILDQTFAFIKANLGAPEDAAHRFIVVHYPVYSISHFGTNKNFA